MPRYSGILFVLVITTTVQYCVSRDTLKSDLENLFNRLLDEKSDRELDERFMQGSRVDVQSDGHTIRVPLQFYAGPSWKCSRGTCQYVVKTLDRNGNEERRVTTTFDNALTRYGHTVEMQIGNYGPYTVQVCVPNNGNPKQQCKTSKPIAGKQRSLLEELLKNLSD